MNNKTVLVTGGGGFIGSHLCERLLAEGMDVICLDNDITSAQGCFVFFMPETAIAYCLSGFDTEEGYSYIIRTDGYIFSHGDKDYVGKLYFYENLYDLDGGASMQTLKMDDKKKIVIVSPMQTMVIRSTS